MGGHKLESLLLLAQIAAGGLHGLDLALEHKAVAHDLPFDLPDALLASVDSERFRSNLTGLLTRLDQASDDHQAVDRFLKAWTYHDEHGDW